LVLPNGFLDVKGTVYILALVLFASTFVGALGGPPFDDLGAFGPPRLCFLIFLFFIFLWIFNNFNISSVYFTSIVFVNW
jgi:hypothetical protein